MGRGAEFGIHGHFEGGNPEIHAVFEEAQRVWDCGLTYENKPYYWRDVAAREITGVHIPLWLIGRAEDLHPDTLRIEKNGNRYEAIFDFVDGFQGNMPAAASPIRSTGVVLSFGSAMVEPQWIVNHTIGVHEYYGTHLRGEERVKQIVAVTPEGLFVTKWNRLSPVKKVVVLARGLRGCTSIAEGERFGAYAVVDIFNARDREVLASGWPDITP